MIRGMRKSLDRFVEGFESCAQEFGLCSPVSEDSFQAEPQGRK